MKRLCEKLNQVTMKIRKKFMVQKFNCYILLTLCEEAYVLKADLSICNMAFGSAVCYFKNY